MASNVYLPGPLSFLQRTLNPRFCWANRAPYGVANTSNICQALPRAREAGRHHRRPERDASGPADRACCILACIARHVNKRILYFFTSYFFLLKLCTSDVASDIGQALPA
jgi:hypothetical protein